MALYKTVTYKDGYNDGCEVDETLYDGLESVNIFHTISFSGVSANLRHKFIKELKKNGYEVIRDERYGSYERYIALKKTLMTDEELEVIEARMLAHKLSK